MKKILWNSLMTVTNLFSLWMLFGIGYEISRNIVDGFNVYPILLLIIGFVASSIAGTAFFIMSLAENTKGRWWIIGFGLIAPWILMIPVVLAGLYFGI